MSNQRRASVAFVLATLGLDALGVGIIAPVVPELVRELGNVPPERAAPWVGALIAAQALVQFFAAVLACIGLSQALAEGVLLQHINARLGARKTAIVGYVAGIAGRFFAFTSNALPFSFPGAPFAPAAAVLACLPLRRLNAGAAASKVKP